MKNKIIIRALIFIMACSALTAVFCAYSVLSDDEIIIDTPEKQIASEVPGAVQYININDTLYDSDVTYVKLHLKP